MGRKLPYKDNCPLAGEALVKVIVYKGEVTTTEKRKLYYGTSDGEFKARFNNHTKSIWPNRYSTDIELSKYIWKISNNKIQYEIK